jgi:AcrR family transcriptional regulator
VTATRAAAAVERALDERHRAAGEEVERILAAAVRVMDRCAPEAPTVTDITVEAGVSRKAFYRYFAGKDDLLLAVLERGVAIIVSYLEHQMAKESDPADQIARWIEGALAQVADPHLISMSRAVASQLPEGSGGADAIMDPMRDLLTAPVTALGGGGHEVDAVFTLTAATMRRYVGSAVRPTVDDIAALVRFCLRGVGADRRTVAGGER